MTCEKMRLYALAAYTQRLAGPLQLELPATTRRSLVGARRPHRPLQASARRQYTLRAHMHNARELSEHEALGSARQQSRRAENCLYS